MHRRKETGSVVALLPLAILIMVIGIGAFAVDTNHNITVRSEMQNGTDAGALAGAHDLIDPATEKNADFTALDVASQNTADGKPLSNATLGDTITSMCSSWDPTTNSATCTVDASQSVNNVFAKIFGHNSDTVGTHSVAIAYRSITGINPNTGFPLIVSGTTTQGNGKELYKMNVGDNFDIYINSQQYKNAAWTSFLLNNNNASWLNNAMEMGLGLVPMQSGVFSGINVGDQANMANGVQGQKTLAGGDEVAALTENGTNFVIPVMTGEPPYNQSHEVIGFVTIHVNSVQINQSGGQVEVLHATLVKGVTKGTGGIPAVSGNTDVDNGIKNLSTGTTMLVQ